MTIVVVVVALVAVCVLPIALQHALWRSRRFGRLIMTIREHDYPMPRPDWTVGDLRRRAERNLGALTFDDPRWVTEDDLLGRLLARLEPRADDEPLTARDIAEWLEIRDLRGA